VAISPLVTQSVSESRTRWLLAPVVETDFQDQRSHCSFALGRSTRPSR